LQMRVSKSFFDDAKAGQFGIGVPRFLACSGRPSRACPSCQ
jgi:hypothetical protein